MLERWRSSMPSERIPHQNVASARMVRGATAGDENRPSAAVELDGAHVRHIQPFVGVLVSYGRQRAVLAVERTGFVLAYLDANRPGGIERERRAIESRSCGH